MRAKPQLRQSGELVSGEDLPDTKGLRRPCRARIILHRPEAGEPEKCLKIDPDLILDQLRVKRQLPLRPGVK